MADDQQPSLAASFMGNAFAAKGMGAIIVLVMTAALGGAGWLLWERSSEDRKALNSISTTLTEHASRMTNDHQTMIENSGSAARQLKMQNYIILADPQEKVEIKRKLGRPAELQ